ncbi:myomesin-2 isoform X2 [Ornithorhynchus anatinus]|uniref:Myomesin 2 n=2 Tax=Ornithorhynchus anatinus TaxID=9258 RepID=F6VM57_ORNAN|nr:myomesin-2 isoform X2 [Ornithorhynchus anatinus]XP_028907205.1 myomesin-2 isoform X2 [Ornithorhynchus anatinus]
MSTTMAVPFYQRRHRHFDQSYRNIHTRYLLQEYAARKRASTESSTQQSSSQKTSTQTSLGRTTCRLCAKRINTSSEDEEHDYKRRYESQLAAYGEDRRQRFLKELAYLEEDVRLAKSLAREKLDKYDIQQMVEAKMAWERRSFEERMSRAPEILVRLRSHTVWEKMSVTLCFTVQGFPTPVVQWYKNESPIFLSSEPGKYRIESKYGVHTLEINRADFDDTATYSAVATNVHGQVSTNAAVIVRRFRGEEEPYHSVSLPIGLPLSSVIPYTHFDVQFLEKFGVTFKTEGETVTLKCSLLVTPELKRLQPRVEWYRDNVLLKESKWTKMFYGEGQASLSFSHLNKDDEGLYTLRLVTRGGVNDHSAFMFVRDAEALVTGAPGAPMDVECHDANRDYVILTWKPPNTASESPVIGYFVDRCEVGTDNWIQCNDAPVKICKYPVTGLFEGRSYMFRVRAVNNAGISRPSRVSDAVAALDPVDLKRMQTIHLEGDREIVIYQDDLEGDIQIPGPPTNVHASETSKTYVVLSWEPPVPRGKEPLMYFIEKSIVGSGSWQRVNSQVAVRSPRYAVFDLAEGKPYVFRVLAANKHGLSDPSEITSPIQAQDSIVIPSSPGRVLASRNTKTSVVVQWDRPKHEDALLGYYIDCCVAGTNKWEPCNHKPIDYNRFVVHGLTTGEQYVFRVKAVNAIGTSENSQESDVIKVQAALTSPSHPYGITLLNCDGHSMTLGWKVPKFSGGAPILGYYMDKREAQHQNWHEVNSHLIKDTIYTVEGLTEQSLYEFKIAAANLAGIGAASDPSEHFKCEAWTMPEPGPSYDLTFCEVRDTSLVILWKAPVYGGSSPVTGYFVDYKEEDAEEWITANETTTKNRYLKVSDLHQGKTYVFRVRAVNANGVGKPSETSEAVLVEAKPGTKEISAGVDEAGNIYLTFDCPEVTDASNFTWCKSYEEIKDDEKFNMETEGDHSKLYFKNPDKSDLGTYSVSVSDTDGVSSSFVMDEKELERLMALSNEIKNPTIPLKSELAYEIFDKGQVRFWLQAEHLSPDASYRFVINDKEVPDSETHRIKCDKSTGIIEMVMDQFTTENEGTYTVQIHDGKAKNQSSLVLIGDAFKAVLEEAELYRKEFLRKQGPHFEEYLHWDVTEECEVLLQCKVANTKNETVFKWLKDDVLCEGQAVPDLSKGFCELRIPKLSKKAQGEYKATLKDDRGQDVSLLELAGKVYDDIILALSRVCGASASPLKILCTPEGIRLQCFMKYFADEMKVNWYHKDAKVSSSEHMRIGGSEEMAWMQICEPTEKDKGKYTFEIFDGKDKHQRVLDLSGQAFDDAFAEFQQLKAAAFAEKNRGKVIGGLPDVVTIMEGKTLNLTCTVFGNPDPEVVWFKNDKDVELSEHFVVKVDQGKYVSMTIKGVASEDSGKYSLNVKNKYGGEKIDVTVSVYKHGEQIPDVAPPQVAKPKLIPASSSSAAE